MCISREINIKKVRTSINDNLNILYFQLLLWERCILKDGTVSSQLVSTHGVTRQYFPLSCIPDMPFESSG